VSSIAVEKASSNQELLTFLRVDKVDGPNPDKIGVLSRVQNGVLRQAQNKMSWTWLDTGLGITQEQGLLEICLKISRH